MLSIYSYNINVCTLYIEVILCLVHGGVRSLPSELPSSTCKIQSPHKSCPGQIGKQLPALDAVTLTRNCELLLYMPKQWYSANDHDQSQRK